MSSQQEGPIAILLAAGVGRRLGEIHAGPKSLLAFDGRSLIDRHLDALAQNAVFDVHVTVGHEAALLTSAIGARAVTVFNPDYRLGSLVSLWTQRALLRCGRTIVLMDGDVLYDARMIARLLESPGEAVLLVDREIEPGDEPVKACFRGGRLVDFRKRPEHAHDWHGESIGFFRFSPAMAAALADRCEHYVARGETMVEYEEAIRDLILADASCFQTVDVTDLPWTEIDFPEDVEKARSVILPQLAS